MDKIVALAKTAVLYMRAPKYTAVLRILGTSVLSA